MNDVSLGVAGASANANWRLVADQCVRRADFDKELYYKIHTRYMFHSYKKFAVYQIYFVQGLVNGSASC